VAENTPKQTTGGVQRAADFSDHKRLERSAIAGTAAIADKFKLKPLVCREVIIVVGKFYLCHWETPMFSK
jgi:hypothetical protein